MQTYRRAKLAVLGWLVAFSLMAGPFGTAAADSAAADKRISEALGVLAEHHVGAPDPDGLADAAIKGMIESLGDPYTEYFTPEELASFQNALDQTYIGVGIRLGTTETGYYIEEIFPGSSALDRNVRAGDFIVEVNGKSIDGWELDQVTEAIRGPEGSEVGLTLQRGQERISVKLERRQVAVPAVTVQPFDGQTAYLRLTTFSTDAGRQVNNALQKLEQEGIGTIVLDLRDNPGGYLQAAQDVASLFIESGVLIHTKNRNGEDEPLYIRNGPVPDFKLVLLVNGGSASASELLAGAFQDHRAAIVVGERTYGKGSVQSLMRLDSGGAVKVTVQEYFTPKRRPVNGVGIKPDVEVKEPVPQLLTALREAGVGKLSATLGAHSTRIMDAMFGDIVTVVREDERVYVPSRVLAAMVGEPIGWDARTEAAVIGAGASARSFAAASPDVRLVGGTSFIALDAFRAAYPAFDWELGADGVTMTAAKESK